MPRFERNAESARWVASGARPTAFNTVRYSEKLLEASGISTETLDCGGIRAHPPSLERRSRRGSGKLADIKKYVTTSGVPEPR